MKPSDKLDPEVHVGGNTTSFWFSFIVKGTKMYVMKPGCDSKVSIIASTDCGSRQATTLQSRKWFSI